MGIKEKSELTDQELLIESRKIKSNKVINAFLIGLMIGITIYSIVENGFGFFTLIPLFIAYKLFNKPKNNDAMEK